MQIGQIAWHQVPCVSDADAFAGEKPHAEDAAYSAAWDAAAAGEVEAMLPLDLQQPASESLDKLLTSYGDIALLARAMKAAFANTNTAENNAIAGSLFRQWVESACAAYADDNAGAF
jgi:hypothetical protein